MDVRELPRILYQEFRIATWEVTETRWVGETAEGAGLVLRFDRGKYRNAALELRWRADRFLEDTATLLLEIEAGLRESGQHTEFVERLSEGAWIRWCDSPIALARDLSQPRVAIAGELIARAREIISAKRFKPTSILYDQRRDRRLEPPLPAM